MHVESGTIFALLGPNGAGKTTMLRILMTLLKPDSGSILINGIDTIKHPNQVKQVIGIVGQCASVDGQLTGLENLRMIDRLHHLSIEEANNNAHRPTSDDVFKTLTKANGRVIMTVYRNSIKKLSWFLSDAFVLAKRNLLHISCDPDQISGLLVLPIMYTLLFRYLFGGAIDKMTFADVGTGDYITYIMARAFVINILFASIITCVGVANDLTKGVVDRFRSLPISPSSVILSYLLASGQSMIIIAIMTILGLIMGFQPTTIPIKWLSALEMLVLMTLAISCLMILIGVSSKNVESAQQFGGLLVLSLSMISSALVPTQTMPSFLRIIAQNQPFTHAIEAIRSLLSGTDIGNHLFMSLIWFIGIIIITFTLSTYLFSSSSE